MLMGLRAFHIATYPFLLRSQLLTQGPQLLGREFVPCVLCWLTQLTVCEVHDLLRCIQGRIQCRNEDGRCALIVGDPNSAGTLDDLCVFRA